jgi:hypothetical protein
MSVSVAQLVERPDRYSNKVVSVVGYYGLDVHSTFLTADARTARTSTMGSSYIFLDFRGSPIPRSSLTRVAPGYVRVTGTFQYRKMKVTRGKEVDYIVPGFGWMNSFERQITKISTFEKVPSPEH